MVSNKADNEVRDQDSTEFYALGLGEPFPVSSLNGRAVADLLDEVVRKLPEEGAQSPYPEDAIKIAIIGRPNVGKSSIVNAILGEKRVIVSEIPGTTRDAVDTVLRRGENTVVLVDTAGIRKAGKIQGSIEYYTVLRAVRAMERADVAMIVIDAKDGLKDGDKRVAGFADEAGRGVRGGCQQVGPDGLRGGHAGVRGERDARDSFPGLCPGRVHFGVSREWV